ncbi:sensor histidine kinase [Actinoplanes subtropicus]|uniref:sensor histidine kinase n=1 Tax=Actinoplanes subtropicus TaxID=543632 RepID=UPI00247FC223|nr:ATP-binding protein [Actinoplanes subtropicus]
MHEEVAGTEVQVAVDSGVALARIQRRVFGQCEVCGVQLAPASGDSALAQSLMANLVSNAIRHNLDGGRVEISTGIIEGRAVVNVRNTGPVVPPDEVERLFQPFQRLGNPRVRRADGHGLGLAIVRAIVTVHRAELSAHPRPEGGLDISVSFTRL